MLSRYGALMQRQAASPQAFLTMIERLAGLASSHTRRSEDSVRLQQFSTPLPLASIVAQAAGFRADDLVLEPSAGTGANDKIIRLGLEGTSNFPGKVSFSSTLIGKGIKNTKSVAI